MENKTFAVTQDDLATSSDRFINYIIDLIVQYALIFMGAIGIGIIGELVGAIGFVDWLANIGKIGEYVLGVVVTVIYYMAMETYCSQTIGKFATKTIVVMEDGSKPDAMTILKRTFCRLIPFDGLTFLSGGRGWHDSIPNVYVVKKQAFERNKELFAAFDEIGTAE